MLELINDRLVFSFPDVHPAARLTVELQRTLRIPDDDRNHPLPPGFGLFPMRHVDDYAHTVPPAWNAHGGTLVPMYQSEALWLNFGGGHYPFAIKVAAGKINAVNGDDWRNGLQRHPTQDYVVHPTQPWLDGYAIERGCIRQFVAEPLGEGFTAEEQLTSRRPIGGLQIVVYPMKRRVYQQHVAIQPRRGRAREADAMGAHAPGSRRQEMGLAPGGRMTQEIYADPYGFDAWDHARSSRVFVHLCDSRSWRAITGEDPPTQPMSRKTYDSYGLPWFDYYDERHTSLPGGRRLGSLQSRGRLRRKNRPHVRDIGPSVRDGEAW